ncbi:type I secretion system permease/ATPase [Pararhodobacter sp.]|uniref:type I secretion system permease/ATPase n=1 Tax=Pararhodobacter sp. TaxID=2127056 RepID=UPI002FDDC82F
MSTHAPSVSAASPDRPSLAVWQGNAPFLAGVLAFSVLVNLLMLTGPLFMLQLYDRVLAARSEATLTALFALVAFLYIMMALLDHARGRITARIGAAFQARLDRRVFDAALQRQALRPADPLARLVQRDLEGVQKLLGSPIFLALFDIPWTPLFIALIFAFHPELGWLALGGGLVLVALALLNQRMLHPPLQQAAHTTHEAERFRTQIGIDSELVGALGMRGAAFHRWQINRHAALCAALTASDRSGFFTTATKSFRLFLQSAMLALGAWLVLRDQITPGLMIASSIILGRALAPVEQVVGQWGALQASWESWRRLGAVLSGLPPPVPRMTLPRPRAHLSVRGVTVVPPGEAKAALRMIDFELTPGRAVGVIGPSGAGKSTLARTVTGAWQPAAGKVRLDGVAIDQFEPDALGRLLGYLPQRVTLFDGTVAENIARLDPEADPAEIVRAARLAGAHAMIVALPEGYDTRISEHAGRLSGGQVQRIGLARALYGDPVLLVLDEPNSNLDAEGSNALNMAIRAAKAKGASVMIMAHRPAAIQECDDLLVLENGVQAAFGPRDEVLRQVVRNHTDLVRPQADAPRAHPAAAGGGE